MSTKPRTASARFIGWGCLAILALITLGGVGLLVRQMWLKHIASPIPVVTAMPAAGGAGGRTNGEYRISLRLSDGRPQPKTGRAAIPLATGEPLSPEEIAQIISRLPALPPAEQEQTDFNPQRDLLPPPLTGSTINTVFPVPEISPTPPGTDSAGPLEVLRYSPEGEIPIAPFVSITFNQPMVPLGTLNELAARSVPVQIEPALPGVWRWLGTKTLTFEYDSTLIDRLPKATEYRVTIPAGTKSAVGGELSQTVSWTFKTPPPQVVSTYPNTSAQPLEPVFFVAFDQRIDPEAVLKTIQVRAGSRTVKVALAAVEEIQKDEAVASLIKYTAAGRWLAFRALEALPPDTQIDVIIGPGTPSAEGPLTTTTAQSFSFSTYGPLRIVEHYCGYWSESPCPPLTPFYIRFSNPLATEVYTDTMLRVTPEIEGVNVNVVGNSLEIRGATRANTTYTVIVGGDIQDIYGQKLGSEATLTFRVGSAEPWLSGPGQNLVTLDPASPKPIFSVYALNYNRLGLQIYAVEPGDWPAFRRYLREWQTTDKPPAVPGRKVADKTLPVEAAGDRLTRVDIDLSEYMDGKFGHFIVVVTPPQGFLFKDTDRYWQTIHAWVQITEIGLDAYSDYGQMVVWATALKDGAPLAGVTVQAEGTGPQYVTGADGTVRFAVPNATYLVASRGADKAFLPYSAGDYWSDYGWASNYPADELRWHVFDDRAMYRPGEEVHVKGWLRRIGGRQDGDVGLVGEGIGSVSYEVTDSQSNLITAGQAKVNALGGFDFAFTVPATINLGYAQILIRAEGNLSDLYNTETYHNFQIQEFRRPEFEVAARNETTGPYFAGGSATVAVEAKYYAGGPLAGADVTWQVTSSPSSYSPPNWPDFVFGEWTPWWRCYYCEFDWWGGSSGSGDTQIFSGKTDPSGTHYLNIDFASQDTGGAPSPLSVTAEATVMDVNRQAWSSRTSLLVHPASLYIGLRSTDYFVERGTPLKVDFIVTDLDGNPVADRPVTVRAARLDWKYTGGNWQEIEADVQECAIGSMSQPVTCSFETRVGGSYRITAMVTDGEGRRNQSSITRWVSGAQLPPARKVEQEQVTLIPDKQSYQPGDVAKILLLAPFSPAEGLLTVGRSGLVYTQTFHIEGGSFTLLVPVEEKYIPNLNIQVDLVGSAPRVDDHGEALPEAERRPAYATGQLNLSIPPLQRKLSLQLTPAQSEIEPGGATTLAVSLTDAAGQPVADAELAVIIVDEAVLALSNYKAADPLATFYTDRPAGITSVYGRASIILADPQALIQDMRQQAADAAFGAGGGEGFRVFSEAPAAAPMPTAEPKTAAVAARAEEVEAPIAVRTNFDPLAVFAPSVHTDANGRAIVEVKVPDNLTRYRVMAVAVDNSGRRFGLGESAITARLPLMVRPSAPRFLNFGDRLELPVVVQNQTDSPLEVKVVLQSSNLNLTGAAAPTAGTAGVRVSVPARDRLEVRFPATTVMAGTARFQVGAVAGAYADAAMVALPVYTPATSEAFATYGVVDEGIVVQPLLAPTGVFTQYGGLEVNTASTALQALTDAMLYLTAYPFECSEQLASRILAVAALRDVLTAFKAEGLPPPEEMEAAVQRDLERLRSMQNDDGGFPYWRRGFESIPFNTVHVAHALYRAQAKGFEVPPEMQSRVLEYLRQIENHYPYWYSTETRRTISAYALYVRHIGGDSDPAKALKLLNDAGLDNLSLETIGWLWPVIQDRGKLEAIRRYVNNRVVETAGMANFTTAYTDQTYLLLSSDRRTDAILLDALMGDSPQSDLIPKLVAGLLAHRQRGRWGSTQENVFVLLALDRYFNTYEAQTPDFVARLWLGDDYAGSYTFRGRTTERQVTEIPMNYLVSGGNRERNLILSKEGAGRLYYRLGLRYAPTDLTLDPLNMGFVVQRRYEAVDNPEDVSRDDQGIWHIKAGARVRVKISLVADNRRYHVALVDPLPAGLEIVNPELAVSGSVPQDPARPDYGYGWWWRQAWYEHQNLRDERAEAFTPLLWDGVYEYSYIARATTPGTFIVPPAKAEEMYSPEVFGRSGSDQVIVQ